MPRIIAADMLAELQRTKAAVVRLLEINTTVPTRWCSPWSQKRSIVIDANTYTPRSFTVSDVAAGAIEKAGAQFVVDNADLAFRDFLLAGVDLTEKTLTYTVLAKETWEDDWAEEYVPLTGQIMGASGTNKSWTLVVAVGRYLKLMNGLRTGEVYCQHRFKGAWCGYASTDVTCDRRYTTCVAKGRQLSYGGFRLAPQPGDVIMLRDGPVAVAGHGGGSGGPYQPGPWRRSGQTGGGDNPDPVGGVPEE